MAKSIEEMRAEKLKALQEATGNEDLTFDSPEWTEGDGLAEDELNETDEAEIDEAWENSLTDEDLEGLEVEDYVNPDFPEETETGK